MASRRKRAQFLTIVWQSLRQVVKAIRKSARSIITRRKERTASKEHYSWTNLFMGLSNVLNRGKKRPYPNAAARGFVLPSVILLLMIAGLVVGTMLSTSTNRAKQVIAERSNQAIVNSASPAIDRAKAKLEFLFNKDPRFPGGLPGNTVLEDMLLNTALPVQTPNPYLFSDETRIDINNNGSLDNAWSFQQDVNGDGSLETIAYSILTKTTSNIAIPTATPPVLADPNNTSGLNTDRTSSDVNKSKDLVSRSGPGNMTRPGDGGCGGSAGVTSVNAQGGWDAINSATVRRSFQVTGVVINPNQDKANRTIATLELQQDRQADLGNKWGAWFRNDLELHPGSTFRWNGAMHTEGNLIVTSNATATLTSGVRAYLISSPASCLYRKENSEVTIAGNFDESISPEGPYLAQVSSGSIRNDSTTASSFSSIWDLHPYTSGTSIFTLQGDSSNDSIVPSITTPTTIALDPVVLQTQDLSQARTAAYADGSAARNTTWKPSLPVTAGRIFNRSARAPFVDDTYRADNRYGPKPKYNSVIPASPAVLPVSGTVIAPTDTYYPQLTFASSSIPEASGLDGYWERRAWAEGLRIIVGQRLELGNANNWKKTTGDTISPDPLYPPVTAALDGRTHERKQWKSLRDNLAAVQSAAIYHTSASSGGGFPKACLALTAHPGTQQTIANSVSFSNFPGTTTLRTDFLTGNGTNGWEFDAPAADETAFAARLATGKPLLKALTNLAYFAGDPSGAFPPTQEASSSTIVHPYPNLTMWGDFSNLRRVIAQLNAGTAYASLSLADQTTLQTAACTVGMLAYNLDGVKASYNAALAGNGDVAKLNLLGSTLFELMDGIVNPASPEITLDSSTTPPTVRACTNTTTLSYCTGLVTYNPDDYANITSGQWIEALSLPAVGATPALITYAKEELLPQIKNYQQIRRDRHLGFARATTPVTSGLTPTKAIPMYDTASPISYYGAPSGSIPAGRYTITPGSLPAGNITKVTGTGGQLFRVFCDPGLFNMGTGAGLTLVTSRTSPYFNRLALAQAFCSPSESFVPEDPALFYVFPVVDHTQNGSLPSTPSISTAVYNEGAIATQPGTGVDAEIYVADAYINGVTVNGASTVVYRAVQGGTGGVSPLINPTSLTDQTKLVVVNPRTRTGGTNNWQLPFSATTAGRVNVINDGVTPVALSFLDKGIFNGREMMGVRVTDIDIDLLRNSSANLTSNSWLPYTGIVYAFREDSLREDGIARPAAGIWTSCDSATEIISTTCRMNAFTPKDPPSNPTTGISSKPVDFYADPDRRPNGFRLRNGADVRRNPTPPTDYQLTGVSFVSDNPVYVMADGNSFNLHNGASSGTRIEEFTTTLSPDWSNFYTRTNLNGNFARLGDTWRPVEIIADAVTILSATFRDGTMAEGILRQNIGGTSSYRTLNAPDAAARSWVREDNSTSDITTADLPILISRDGNPVYCVDSTGADAGNIANCIPSGGVSRRLQSYATESLTVTVPGTITPLAGYAKANGGANRTYMAFTDDKGVAAGVDGTRMNFTIVNAIIPSRAGNTYGGFHNFPRLLEDWSSRNLYLLGSFIQLNFSTSATGLYDQDVWEPNGAASGTGESLKYYGAAIRNWGYDVGLQYSPPGPVAKRFTTPSNTRSEFYQTLPASDPYVKNLRCAKSPPSTGPRIDPTLSVSDCT